MDIVGSWVIDRTDSRALAELGDVSIKFEKAGKLTYTIHCQGKDQIIKLRYKIDGDVIITDQPSAPHVERTGFFISEDGVLLTLAFNGVPCRFERQHYICVRQSRKPAGKPGADHNCFLGVLGDATHLSAASHRSLTI